MAAVSRNQLILDLRNLMATRGLRHANLDSNDSPRIFEHTGGTLTPGTNKTLIVFEFDDATLTLLDEKAFGAAHPHVPVSTRT